MRTVGVVTVARSDWGIYRPVLRAILEEPDLQLRIYAAGMHLSPEFGRSLEQIEEDGFAVDEKVDFLLSSDTPEGIAKSMGMGVVCFAQAFARARPDMLLVLGDRFEMHAAALAALPLKIPLAHIHGGEVTRGAIDDALRHSITKLSHFHFVATEEYRRRIIQLGEDPERVVVSGAPGLDNLQAVERVSLEEVTTRHGIELDAPPLLVTYHPVTLEWEETAGQVEEVLAALSRFAIPVVFTLANADTAGRQINQRLREYTQDRSDTWLVDNLGTQSYFSLMSHARAMVGNSSSGIIEAASFALPVVNIGHRQEGRMRPENVIDVECKREAITEGISRALSPRFRNSLREMNNPYGDGRAAGRIASFLKEVSLDEREVVMKRFHDLDVGPDAYSPAVEEQQVERDAD